MLFALAGAAAVLNWVAVERENKRLEYIAKPATTLFLLAAAVALTPDSPSARGWLVVALAFCLLGDIFLMLPRDAFVPGLASFLIGHLCFVVGLARTGFEVGPPFIVMFVFVAAVMPVITRPVLNGARRQDAALTVPVLAYIGVLNLLLLAAAGTEHAVAIAGAAVFVSSDYILARNRFVRPLPHGHLATMVTYHAALALLVVSLL